MVWKGPDIVQDPPESYNPEDPFADPVALHEAREAVVWRKEVRIEKAKVLGPRITLQETAWLQIEDKGVCNVPADFEGAHETMLSQGGSQSLAELP